MSEHTPGPWRLERRTSGIGTWLDVMAGNLLITRAAIDGAFEPATEQDYANAHLMAAAPDLEAVALAYEQWEADVLMEDRCWRNPTDGEPLQTPRITQALWDRLIEIQGMRNAALAKARGGER